MRTWESLSDLANDGIMRTYYEDLLGILEYQ